MKLAIIVGKMVSWVARLIGRGSVAPGNIALKIDKNLFKKMEIPKTVIAVTGSSGKGSTSSMITDILRNNGYKVAYNDKGSNIDVAILSLLIERSDLNGKANDDVLVCECDERYCRYIFPYIHPQYVVVTNITRDQPPRQGHFDLVYDKIKEALTPKMHLILNADDPYLYKLVDHNPVTYYGIADNKYAYDKSKFNILNIERCPICNTKLKYSKYYFETLGLFKCPKCAFKRIQPDYEIKDIDYTKNIVKINDNYVHVPYNMLYCLYNTLACYSVLSLLRLDEAKIVDGISQIKSDKHNHHVFEYQDRKIHVLNNKNENATTFNESILYVDRFKEHKAVIIGWKEISRRYKFDDLSWLYDCEFEILNNEFLDYIVCTGPNAYDIATRLKYANILTTKIKIIPNLEAATTFLKDKTRVNVYAILNFDYIKPFNQYMGGDY